MQTKFTTSVNIIRDANREIRYIPTPNATRIVNQIVNDFKRGIRSFNIIGSYGTGKSAFLWAFRQSINKRKRFFNIDPLPGAKIETIDLVGEFKSMKSVFADFFEISASRLQSLNIFSEIFNRYYDLGKKNALLVILVDEFGKFLEYAAKNSPENELYFIQQLSEFVNNPDHNIILITTVHQNIDAYAFGLSNPQKQEWTKVKGRFKEIPFNEPIEQLLFLASEHLKRKISNKKIETAIKSALTTAKKSKAFTINSNYASDVISKLYPLDLISANILTISLQKYGQNERSLFSFLESADPTGINQFDHKINPFYNTACVYDYIVFNFYSYINSRYNPDFSAWSGIKNSLEAAANHFDTGIFNYTRIIKTIGILNINATMGADLGKEFLVKYSNICLGISNASELIENLEQKKIILYRNYSKRYVLFEGTDLDISSALIEAGNKVTEISDVATMLNRYYHLPPVYAKSYSYKNGTARLFEYRISGHPITDIPLDETDGFINLIFNENIDIAVVRRISLENQEAIIYGYYQNTKTIKNQLFEIEKTQKVISENGDDKIAVKELNNILLHQKNLLTHYILNSLYSQKSGLKWIFKGQDVNIPSKRAFNQLLSLICDHVYSMTPVFKNELVNKHKISYSIHTAKRNYFRALVDNWNRPDLDFEPNKFPPEKTIYQTLLKENGISLYSNEINFCTEISPQSSFSPLWSYSIDFLNSTKKSKKTISEFVEPLTKRPFKIKQGLIDFWIGTFLFIKRDDYALYGESGYIPYITEEVLELVLKYPSNYEIKAFNIDGVKLDIFNSYRIFLNQHSKASLDNQSFIETIKPFMTFYKGLSYYSRNTRRLKKETIAIREAISTAKDPEKSFFEDFPLALGYNEESLQRSKEKLNSYIAKLQDSIKELRTSYEGLLNRVEDFILQEFIGETISFSDYRGRLQKRFSSLKRHLCLPHQKTFVQRIESPLEDKNAWLASIGQSVLGKSLETIQDDEEIILYERFKTTVLELDSLSRISNSDVDEEKEDVLGIELSSFVDGIKRSLIRLPKTKKNDVLKIELLIKSNLSKDKSLNIAALAHILKDQINNE